MKTVLMSRGRASKVETTDVLDLDIAVVPKSEVDEYKKYLPEEIEIMPIPDSVGGISSVRNWIIRNIDDEIIVMFDDDVRRLRSMTRLKNRVCRSDEVMSVIANTAQNALDVGAHIFGWNQNWDVRKYCPTEPFNLCGWVGGVVGVIGKTEWWDEKLKARCDIDACMTALMKDRFIWIENRFSWVQKRDTNTGGATQGLERNTA